VAQTVILMGVVVCCCLCTFVILREATLHDLNSFCAAHPNFTWDGDTVGSCVNFTPYNTTPMGWMVD
jgi:hypothetical protein